MKRVFDLVISAGALIVLAAPMLLIGIAIRVSSPGPALHWSHRIGRGNRSFMMPKFRTMRIDTPQIATHLMVNPDRWLTPIGRWLRATSVAELPQLWSVLIGEMSMVGPRPALFNQYDLIKMRTEKGIHELLPGLTGLAQVSGRDDLSISAKVKCDADYCMRRSLAMDLRIIAVTLVNAVRRENISH